MLIRKAQEADVKFLYEIELENYGEEEATELETFKEIVSYPDEYKDYCLMVLTNQNDVLGFYCTIEEDTHVELVDIAVKKSQQGNGFGKLLMSELLNNNKDKPVKLTVRADNTSALKLYESFSFTLEELKAGYYEDCDGHRMVRK